MTQTKGWPLLRQRGLVSWFSNLLYSTWDHTEDRRQNASCKWSRRVSTSSSCRMNDRGSPDGLRHWWRQSLSAEPINPWSKNMTGWHTTVVHSGVFLDTVIDSHSTHYGHSWQFNFIHRLTQPTPPKTLRQSEKININIYEFPRN